ncbi:MAG: Rrf2 family transcriptional regulator [Gemmatimonadaceae bacterium]
MLSQTVEYALRASLHIARRHPEPMRVSDIAAAVDAPRGYLAKILGNLARAGVLDSSRGPTGGFRLGSPPEQVALLDVVRAIDGAEDRRCLLGHGKCGDNPSCTAHARWAPIATEVDDFFGKTTLADLLHTPRLT